MNVAVLGYGLVGKERIRALHQLRGAGCPIETLAVYDPHATKDRVAFEREGGVWLDSLEDVEAVDPDWVIVATPHDVAIELVERFLARGSGILLEKPLGRSLAEAQHISSKLKVGDKLWVGFNYRFFQGIAQAIADARQGLFGNIISVSMTLGHGGSPGMEKCWKLDPIKAGGGCLIDPGIHLIDLCHLLSPAGIKPLKGWFWSGFWKTGIEEEVHLLLEGDNFLVNLQVSIVRWRSTFRLEIQGTEGYGVVTGRNRSYGPQTYIRGKRWGWLHAKSQKESEEHVLTSNGDDVFRDELDSLLQPHRQNYLLPPCSSHEALTVMSTYDECLRLLGL